MSRFTSTAKETRLFAAKTQYSLIALLDEIENLTGCRSDVSKQVYGFLRPARASTRMIAKNGAMWPLFSTCSVAPLAVSQSTVESWRHYIHKTAATRTKVRTYSRGVDVAEKKSSQETRLIIVRSNHQSVFFLLNSSLRDTSLSLDWEKPSEELLIKFAPFTALYCERIMNRVIMKIFTWDCLVHNNFQFYSLYTVNVN